MAKARMNWINNLARSEQVPPQYCLPGSGRENRPWDCFIYMAGRGAGKTRAAAEWIVWEAINKPKSRWAILADMSMHEFISRSSQNYVQIVTPQATAFAGVLAASGAVIRAQDANSIEVAEITSATVGDLALKNQVVLHQLTDMAPSLESAFMELTEDQVSFHGHAAEDKK